MTPESYANFARLLLDRIGLVLGDGKEYLLATRLTPIADQYGLGSLDGIAAAVGQPGNETLVEQVVDALTRSEPSFFPGGEPFEALFDEVLPRLMARRADTKRLRIWNAACSTGQEPYSIVMGLADRMPELLDWTLSIKGTDSSQDAIDRARSGSYRDFEIQSGISIRHLARFFDQDDQRFELKPEIRRHVSFDTLNLLEPFASLGEQDVIFIRDALIYFDPEVKQDILERVSGCLATDGYLILGSTERVAGLSQSLERAADCPPMVFSRKDASTEVSFG